MTLTKAPGIGLPHGKNNGLPSSMEPVNLLQIGFTPRSGLLFPTRTVIIAGLFAQHADPKSILTSYLK
mgnify:CR=1 FL=1